VTPGIANLTTIEQTDQSEHPLIFNMEMDPGETMPLPTHSEEYKTMRPILEKIIVDHRASMTKAIPDLNYCDDAVMNWSPPGCASSGQCITPPDHNKQLCYWDH
jgi:N-acetylgalactosamine-6-sulfatase